VTEQEILEAIKIAFPAGSSNADVVAKSLLKKAILKLGRTPAQAWNSTSKTFALQANKGSYQVGLDILGGYEDFVNMQELWCNDARDNPIPIVTLDEFNSYARGGTSTGRPTMATLHSDEEILEFYPIPDSAYSIWGYIQKAIENLADIPDTYHDVLIDLAIDSLNVQTAGIRAREGTKEIKGQSLTRWDGNTFRISRHLGGGGTNKPDSHNLRGD
jgi:hypothetical protein